MNKLTIKQEKFARKYIELGNASEAYRQSHDAENMGNDSIKVEASRLLKNPNIALTVVLLREEHADKHAVTVESLTRELEEARSMAIIEKQNSAAVSATMGKAKLHGLDAQKVEVGGDIQITVTKKVVSASD